MGGGTSLLLALPETDDELGVESPCDCGAHGAHQAQFRFESQAGRTSYWQQASLFLWFVSYHFGLPEALCLCAREGRVARGVWNLRRFPGLIWPRLPANQLSAAVSTTVNRGECWGAAFSKGRQRRFDKGVFEAVDEGGGPGGGYR